MSKFLDCLFDPDDEFDLRELDESRFLFGVGYKGGVPLLLVEVRGEEIVETDVAGLVLALPRLVLFIRPSRLPVECRRVFDFIAFAVVFSLPLPLRGSCFLRRSGNGNVVPVFVLIFSKILPPGVFDCHCCENGLVALGAKNYTVMFSLPPFVLVRAFKQCCLYQKLFSVGHPSGARYRLTLFLILFLFSNPV